MPDKTWLFLHKGMEIERVRIRVFEEALVEREEEKKVERKQLEIGTLLNICLITIQCE